MAVSSDSQLIATCCIDDKSIKIWRADTGQMLHTLHIKTHQFFCVDFSNDGSVLVSAGSLDLPGRKYNYAFEIQVWGLQPGNTPALLRTLTGHNHSILTVKVSPDSQKLVSTSCDKTVRTWCVGSGMQLAVFREHQRSLSSTIFRSLLLL